VETHQQWELREQQEALLMQQPHPQVPAVTLLLPLPQPVMQQAPPVVPPIVPVVPPVAPPVPPVPLQQPVPPVPPVPPAGGAMQGPV